MAEAVSPPARAGRQDDWEARLRHVPTAEQVLALMTSEDAEACRARWGDFPSHLIRRAERLRRRGLRTS